MTFKFQEMYYPKGYFQLIKHIGMIVKIKKKPLLVLRNRVYIYTQFDAQNAVNSVSELPDLKFFWGSMPPDPPSKRGLAAPCQYCRLLLSNWLPTSNFVETPVIIFLVHVVCLFVYLKYLLKRYSCCYFNKKAPLFYSFV